MSPSTSAQPEAPLIEAAGVVKRFPGVLALDGVSFGLRAGEAHALVGENGAGKSTLLKVLTGVYRPDAGGLRLRGEPVAFGGPFDAQRAGIQAIHQEIGLVPLMSVARNLLLGREPRNRLGLIDMRALHRAAEDLLAPYGVRIDVRRPLRSCGVGTQQMVALARAVSVDARVVVMDEPTSSLEPREVETLFGVIRDLRARGIAVVYVSHRLDELFRVCSRVTVLRDGRMVHTGDLADLDRLRLVSLMLGRDMAEVRAEGMTKFSGDHERAGDVPVLEARGLTRRHQLDGVSVTVRPGEVVGLGGLLGSGRSETAKAIAGALPLDAGTVVVAGTPLRWPTTANATKAGIAMLPEDRKAEGIVPALSIRENIALAALPGLSRAGIVSDARIDRIVGTFMKRLRIKASSMHQRVGELSGGNQQKVLLARWLATEPKVLLLDEPTRGIDVGAKAEVQTLIDELAREGLGVLLISSDLEELVEGADRVVVLRDGAVAGELTGDQVSEQGVMAAIAAEPEPPAAAGPAPGDEAPGDGAPADEAPEADPAGKDEN
ncbi:sugar ABC transporter ATP-binding protein [Actinomadura darangshiensis]|uniref:Sugar ABC transporter ATP-binding protein n=1 Tax=Actinomadura darangshiensis TaxID=705336 RepID=A0A4R5BI94_9ACTN|nr:sugar ABC transporter ATP-binding protein [Actinomadura darangshiensis]TDD85465.1 sugar ABC transporter ATP-binding protein [Actinomadura darangshiensis]